VRDYGAANEDPAEHWLALLDGEPIGWIQCYAWVDGDEEEANAHFAAGVERTAAGIDYLVGEPSVRGKGVGTELIRTFVHDVVFPRHPGWTQASAGPFVANEASWRALERAGFRQLGDYPTDDGPCRVMVIDRPGRP